MVTPPSPDLSGTTLTVAAGQGALFPNPSPTPFNCTVVPFNTFPTLSNSEIVRVTAIVGDTFTIMRAQEGTTAKHIAAGWLIANSITVKTITDIEAATGGGGSGVSMVTGLAPVVSSGGTTPQISIPVATAIADGYLSSTDWSTFNSKQPSGSYLTAVTSDAPLSGSGTSGSHLVISKANGSTDGYLSSADWNTFNGKQGAGNYITALTGDVTASGPGSAAATLATVNGNVGTFGSSTAIPVVTVNAKGLATAASTAVVVAPAGTLTGTTLASNVVNASLNSIIPTGVTLQILGILDISNAIKIATNTFVYFDATHHNIVGLSGGLQLMDSSLAVRALVSSAGLAVTGASTASTYIKPGSYIVSGLPAAATAGGGAMAYVTDANATTRLSTVAGGGSNKVMVFSDNANWLIL